MMCKLCRELLNFIADGSCFDRLNNPDIGLLANRRSLHIDTLPQQKKSGGYSVNLTSGGSPPFTVQILSWL